MERFAALDIGSSKIVYLIGERDSYGELHVIGIGEVKSKGVYKGIINNLNEAKASIKRAFQEAEEMAGVKVRDVVYNVSGASLKNNTVKSQNERESITISPNPTEIERSHVSRLLERCRVKSKEDGYEIVFHEPRKFILDDQGEVKNPLGLLGSKLSAEVHVVKVSSTIIKNLEKAIRETGLNPVQRVVSAIASARAVLKPDEMEDGVLVMDIGAGLTDYTLYHEGTPLVTGVVPFGGNNITKDLSHYLKLDTEEAERVKLKYGHAFAPAVPEDEEIQIKPRGEEKEVTRPKREIADVIQARLEEIIEKVFKELESQGVKRELIKAGVVVTGGTANLPGIKELVEHMTGLPARIGYPEGIIGLKEKINDPRYATAVGLLRTAFEREEGSIGGEEEGGGFFKELWRAFRRLFEDIA
ncbi:MAG: cell division protein FtsA [Aquificae bacterium]|nr:cell division protein FtsA [Aquificota bacterium]